MRVTPEDGRQKVRREECKEGFTLLRTYPKRYLASSLWIWVEHRKYKRRDANMRAIRFAAANHLCVDLRYDGSVRRIEPYSFRQTGPLNIAPPLARPRINAYPPSIVAFWAIWTDIRLQVHRMW